MGYILLLIIGVVVIFVMVVLLLPKPAKDKVVGICATVVGLDAKKKERKENILALLSERKELSNSDIREALGMAERSVVRYLDELEKEGKVEQVGATGRSVVYRIKQ